MPRKGFQGDGKSLPRPSSASTRILLFLSRFPPLEPTTSTSTHIVPLGRPKERVFVRSAREERQLLTSTSLIVAVAPAQRSSQRNRHCAPRALGKGPENKINIVSPNGKVIGNGRPPFFPKRLIGRSWVVTSPEWTLRGQSSPFWAGQQLPQGVATNSALFLPHRCS